MRVLFIISAVFFLLNNVSSVQSETFQEKILAAYDAYLIFHVGQTVTVQEGLKTDFLARIQVTLNAYANYQQRIIQRVSKIGAGGSNVGYSLNKDYQAFLKQFTSSINGTQFMADLDRIYNKPAYDAYHAQRNSLLAFTDLPVAEATKQACWDSNQIRHNFDGFMQTLYSWNAPTFYNSLTSVDAGISNTVTGIETAIRDCRYKWKCITDFVSRFIFL